MISSRSFIALLLIAGIFASSTASAPQIDQGVVLRPLGSWADITFVDDATFGTDVVIASTSVTLDSVTVEVRKFPETLPRMDMTITVWNPTAAGSTGDVAVRFTASVPGPAQAWFNITGLRTNLEYVVTVDGNRLGDVQQSGPTGRVAIAWSAWSQHVFEVRTNPLGGVLPLSQGLFAVACLLFVLILIVTILAAGWIRRNAPTPVEVYAELREDIKHEILDRMRVAWRKRHRLKRAAKRDLAWLRRKFGEELRALGMTAEEFVRSIRKER